MTVLIDVCALSRTSRPPFSLVDDAEHDTSSSHSEMDIKETHKQSMSKGQEERTVKAEVTGIMDEVEEMVVVDKVEEMVVVGKVEEVVVDEVEEMVVVGEVEEMVVVVQWMTLIFNIEACVICGCSQYMYIYIYVCG